MARCTTYTSTDIEQLGFLLNRDPYNSQTEVLKLYLNKFSQAAVVKLINHPIRRYSGQTSVHLAATNGLWECLEILLVYGGNPNAVSAPPDLCQTPLHLAARKGYERCLQILLDNGANMEIRNTRQEKAIHLVKGKTNCERVFTHAIAKSQIPNRTSEQKQRVTDLFSMLTEERLEAFCFIYDQLPQDHKDLATRWTDLYQQTLLYRAAADNMVEVVDFLLSRSANQPLHNLDTYDTPLHVACRNNNIKIASMLLKHSPGLIFIQDAQTNRSALHLACSRGNTEMVCAILEALDHVIVEAGDHPGRKFTLDFLDESNRTPLFNACYYGYVDIVKRLIHFGYKHKECSLNLNSPIKGSQRTPLHVAVKQGSIEIVKTLLLCNGIEINPEARPSKETHKRLIRLIQMLRTGGRQMPPVHTHPLPSVTEEPGNDSVSPSHPTPGIASPLTSVSSQTATGTNSSDSPTSGYHSPSQELKSPKSSSGSERVAFTDVPKKRSSGEKQGLNWKATSTPENIDVIGRQVRSVTNMVQSEESAIGVFLVYSGKLEVLPRENTQDCTIFDKLLITPLAEACVYGREEIMKTLLEYGAKDTDGLACRIAHLLAKPELMQLILSYDCSLVDPTKEQKTKYGKQSPHWLHLEWSNKFLPSCNSLWFSREVVFHPLQHNENDEDTHIVHRTNSAPRKPARTRVSSNRIKEVSLDTNNLAEVPIELFMLPEIHEINLSRNNLTRLPEVVPILGQNISRLVGWECTQLTELNISRNRLQSLPSCIWFLPNLLRLKATNNDLTSLLPNTASTIDDTTLSTTLNAIDVSSNKLQAIPDFVFKFQELKRVNVSNNQLMSIPETLWACKSLQELDVSNNKLTVLPWCEPEDSMEDSREESGTHGAVYRHADRVMAGIDVVKPISPLDVSSLRRQPSMYQSVTPIREASDLAFTTSLTALESCDYSSLSKLNISKNRFTYYPEALPCLAPNLTEMDVSGNTFEQIDIQFIPHSIKKFTARRCGLKRFGNVIDKRLYTVVTHFCRHGLSFGLPCQHRSHPRLPCLTTLHLTGNKLRHFQLLHHRPQEVSSEETDCGAKETTYVSGKTSLDLLYPVLEGLDLEKNDLRGTFNPNIGYQAHLQWVWLSSNINLEKLPFEFSHLKNTRQFTELSFDGTPKLIDPPQEYQTVSLSHLLTYMRSRLKESRLYRTIKLFFIGSGERGKTTLLRRLQGISIDKLKRLDHDRTIGIDVVDWTYTASTPLFRSKPEPVHFLAWDFAGQDVYHTTHQCFYSRRSLYLALFRLCDGLKGIEELEQWLRNVKLRAPGCPVIIVGTHLDKVSEGEATALENRARQRFSDPNIYPRIIATSSICSVSRNLFSNHMEKLRVLIYNVACHLQLAKDGFGLEYKPDMDENDPKALFQQMIPTTYLELQSRLREKVKALAREGMDDALIMEEAEFKREFLAIFGGDEEELHEAVYCLNLQGTLLHFEDPSLKNIYFLDPQWLAKLMANVIRPSATMEDSPIKDGVAEINTLFSKLDVPQTIKDKYISLLEKFEVALTIKGQRIIIPSLLPDSIFFPKPDENLSDVNLTNSIDECYQPPLRRLWISDYIPDGFWPRLICRVVNDQQITKILRTVIGEDPYLMEEGEDSAQSAEVVLDWMPWKTGIVYKCKGHTLLLIKQEVNQKPAISDIPPAQANLPTLPGEYRIEVHIYTNEWVKLLNYLSEQGVFNPNVPPNYIPGLATRLLVVLSTHIKALAQNYFSGMLLSPQGGNVVTYMPCWKCFAEIPFNFEKDGDYQNTVFVWKGITPVTCFGVEDSIVRAIQGEDFECHLHGKILAVHLAPDLIFWDLTSQYEDSSGNLRILENEVLGKGGFGFVCKGEIAPDYGAKKLVAVKVFLQDDVASAVEHSTIQELLVRSREPKHILFGYKEIRQEVSFLASLSSPFLTELCGVKLSPHMCLMLELAPQQSLRVMLKKYKEERVFLEPLTLKNTALQIAKGLEYLHRHQVVHLDIKSPNVLVWHFPSPLDTRQVRVRQAGNVWIKLADYGISQLSTRQTLRVSNNPVGTPGFMAPELFDHSGQEVPAEKVDIFALGMTFYEMLSHKTPFDNILPHIKRNQEVKNKHRPHLQAKETRSLILFQELMTMCWDHESEKRPKAQQICDWVEAPEFERLRAQISLKGVKSISCACVCRILPQNEEKFTHPGGQSDHKLFNVGSGNFLSTPTSPIKLTSVLDKMDDIFQKYREAEPDSIGSPRHNILLSNTGEEVCIETGTGEKIKDEDEDIYQFLPSRRGPSQGEMLASERAVANEPVMAYEFEPYTQIWLCGRGDRKGVLQVFTYNDGHAGHFTFSGFCSKEEVTAICSVRNLMWMGTANGNIKIFHAPTLKVRFAGKMEVQGGSSASFILNIVHVPEASCVLVASHNCEIWVFSDRVLPGGLKVRERISIPEFSPCFHLVKVPHSNPNQVEVWGTMDHNRILVLDYIEKRWNQIELESRPGDPRLTLCSYITNARFTGVDGRECNHVWVSYRNRSIVVCFDALTRKQRVVLDCSVRLRQNRDEISFQVATMVAQGKKLFIGTAGGIVATFDSESGELLNSFSWHKEKVRTLLVMPKEMEPSICNEIPFSGEEENTPDKPSHSRSNPRLRRGISAFSYMDNQHYIDNPEPDSVVITSIGNGRRRYQVHELTKEDRIRIFNETDQFIGRRPTAIIDKSGEDIVLLQWRS